MDITFQFVKKRGDFGRQPLFCEQGAEMCDSIPTNPAEFKKYILRNPVMVGIQNTPNFSANHINTVRVEYTTSGANHAEGGWAKDINVNDPEAVQRYRRKVEKEDGYIHCVNTLSSGMEHYVLQNNAIDMYRSYFAEMEHALPAEHIRCRTVNVYRDRSQRSVSRISWDSSGCRFSACHMDVNFNRNPLKQTEGNIWNVDRATQPELEIQPEAPMPDLQFNPRDPNLLACGYTTGQVAEFDLRAGPSTVNVCPPHVAHRDLVRQVLFINSKTGKEFFSGSPDGALKWWDSRNLSAPTDEIILDMVKAPTDPQSMATAYGASVIEYEGTIPTRFMVGTENGLVIGGNRKGKTPSEQLPAKFDAQLGSIRSLQRNPGFPKNFLTVGDWSAKIWSEECRESAILWTPEQRYQANYGAWSCTRLSLFTLCMNDGQLAFWDVLRSHKNPVLSIQVCSEPLLTQTYHSEGRLIALGNKGGDVFLEELSEHLVYSEAKDKTLLGLIFDRLTKRERILEARLREIKLKARQVEEGSEHGSLEGEDYSANDKDLAEATAEYFATIKKEISLMH